MLFLSLIAALFLLLGGWSFRRIRTTESFAVADRSAPTGLVTGSLVATIVGGSSTLGMAGLAYSKGLVATWWLLGGVIGLAILSGTLVEKIRTPQVFTLPELLGRQYGPRMQVVASTLIAAAWLGVIAGQMVAAGHVLTTLTPLTTVESVFLAGAVMVVYATLGGQHSILRTDAVQCLLVLLGVILCAVLGVVRVGGLAGLQHGLPPGHLRFPLRGGEDVAFVLRMVLLVGVTYLVGPDIYSRLFCARNAHSARRAVKLTALLLVPLAFAVAAVGLAACVQFPGLAAERAFPTVVTQLLPHWAAVLVVGALLAALMSSADTCLVTAGVILGLDLVGARLRKEWSPRHELAVCRSAVLLVGVVSLVVALRLQNVIASLLLGYTLYAGGLVVPTLAGFWHRRLNVNTAGAIAAAVVGGTIGLAAKIGGPANLDLLAIPASAVALFAGSWVFGSRVPLDKATDLPVGDSSSVDSH